ncbi:hypothetical protein LguiA_022654 [Lonicera macranthoides]
MANVLVVATTMGMVHWVHSYTTDPRPTIPLNPELVVRISSLQERFLCPPTSGNLANHSSAPAWHDLLGSGRKLDPR